jgi:PhoPQ-activated pathogenicity-related protein
MTHNKTGYEIRLEILQMAMGLANDRYHTSFNCQRDYAEKAGLKAYEVPNDDRVQDAIKIAEELYTFVDRK